MSLYQQVKHLYDEGLYSNVINLANLLLSASDRNPELLSPNVKVQILVYYGDSLYHTREYKKAESIYRIGLQMKKTLTKVKEKVQGMPQTEGTSEIDIKYQIHLCHSQLKQSAQAIAMLESIPAKQRTPKVNMALASLYHQSGQERSAITAYKEVLKECPLALDAAQGLLMLGVKGTEVASSMVNGTSTIPNMDWLSSWIKGHVHLHSREFSNAAATFRQLDSWGYLRDNVNVLVSLGESYNSMGDHLNAIATLQRVHTLDPLNLKGMDVLAALLVKEKRVKDLENLATHLMSVTEHSSEPWIAMSYLSFVTKKSHRALYLAQKACQLNVRNVEAMMLKGTILLEMKKLQESVSHFREALKIAPFRYEAHKGLIDSYLALHRTREAISVASNTCKLLGQTPRTLTLYAYVLAKDPLSVEKSKSLLEKALKQEPTYLNAVYQLADIYEHEKQYSKGIELLRRQVAFQSTCRLHQMLGDLLARTNEHERALDHYNMALNLDPNNSRVLEAVQRMEHPTESGYDVEVEDAADSDNEAELEDSEIDAVWSDVDFT